MNLEAHDRKGNNGKNGDAHPRETAAMNAILRDFVARILTDPALGAFAIGQDIAYVSIAHISRIVFIIFATPFVWRGMASRRRP